MSPKDLVRHFADKATPNQLVALLGRGVKFFVGAQWCYYRDGLWVTVDGDSLPSQEMPTEVSIDEVDPGLVKVEDLADPIVASGDSQKPLISDNLGGLENQLPKDLDPQTQAAPVKNDFKLNDPKKQG